MNDLMKKHLIELEAMYCSLVWYARGSCFGDDVDKDIYRSALKARAKVEAEYPEEVGEFADGPNDWQHGFNSGMLAAVRLILARDTDDADVVMDAVEAFPDLGT